MPQSCEPSPFLFIVVGAVAFFAGWLPLPQRVTELKQHPIEFGLAQIVRILGVIGGAFMLWSFNWARWLPVAWFAFHVILSAFHAPVQLVVHGLLAAVIVYFLFQAPATAYFSG